MAGLFDGIQELAKGGLGLAGDAIRGAGGILRDTATVPFTSPAPEVINRGPVGNLLLRLAQGVAATENRPGPVQNAIARQVAMAEQRKKAFQDNLGVLAKVGDFLDSVPASERPQRLKELRDRYVNDFGGANSGALFDAVHGSPESALGTLAALKDSPEIQRMINRGATFEEITAYRKSPEFTQLAQDRQDKLLLPTIEKKIGALLQSKAPAVRERLEQVARDGKITADEIRQLNEVAGQGEQGAQLNPGELESLVRVQDEIAQRIPGFVTTSEFQAQRESSRKLAESKLEKQADLAAKKEFEQFKQKIEQKETLKETDIAGMRKEFTRLSGDFLTIRDSGARVESVASDASAAGDLALIFNYMKILDPGSVVRESEFATAQNAAGVPERIRAQYNNLLNGERLSESTRQDFLQTARKLVSAQTEKQQELEQQFRDLATRKGVDPRDVVIDFVGGAEPAGGAETPSDAPLDIQAILEKYR